MIERYGVRSLKLFSYNSIIHKFIDVRYQRRCCEIRNASHLPYISLLVSSYLKDSQTDLDNIHLVLNLSLCLACSAKKKMFKVFQVLMVSLALGKNFGLEI